MNPTHETDHNPAQPRAFGENFLVDLFTDDTRFRNWVTSANATAAQPAKAPTETDLVGYDLTDEGRAALNRLVTGADTTPSTCPVDLVTETDDETTARILRGAALYLERHGWIQGAYYDATTGVFTPPADVVGAIGMVCYGGPSDAPAQHFDDPGFLDFEAAVLHLDRYLLAEDGTEAYEFNDAKGRRLEDVTRVLRDAATRPAEELIDALRVIDQKNADMAALAELLVPSGVFLGTTDVPDPVEHAEYPHHPGTLYDCPACEAQCFCADGFRCVHCALEGEQSTGTGSARGEARPGCPTCGNGPEWPGVLRDRDELQYCDDECHFRITDEGGAE